MKKTAAAVCAALLLLVASCGGESGSDIEMKGVDWPDPSVVPIRECVRVNSINQTDEGVWNISIETTAKQYDDWAARMVSDGFLHAAGGFYKSGFLIDVNVMPSYAVGGDYSLRISINRNPSEWPSRFSEFPKFEESGIVVSLDSGVDVDDNDKSFEFLNVYVVGSSDEAFSAYEQKVRSKNFKANADGDLEKRISGKSWVYVGVTDHDDNSQEGVEPTKLLRYEIR